MDKRVYYSLIALIFVSYLAPLVVLRQNSYVPIYDNLDSIVPTLKTLAESGKIFAKGDEVIEATGLPRKCYASEFSILLWLFALFPPFYAYLANQILMRIVAFLGMHLLLKSFVLPDEEDYRLVGVCALGFSLLPFFPGGGLSVAGIPALTWAFLNLRAGDRSLRNWLIIAVYVLYSSLIFAGFFFLAVASVVFCRDVVRTRRFNVLFFAGMGLTAIGYLLVEYRLVLSFFLDSGFVSHRTEFLRQPYPFLKMFHYVLIFGHQQATGKQFPVIGFTVFLALCCLIKKRRFFGLIPMLCAALVATSAIVEVYFSSPFFLPVERQFRFLSVFNISRFFILDPTVWTVLFALSLKQIQDAWAWGKRLVLVLLIGQGAVLFYGSDFVQEYRWSGLTYREFFAEDLFDAVEREIGRPRDTFRVVSIGIHPGMAIYNGFRTLDFYWNNYPLERKHAFREIIAPELEKNEEMRKQYDYCGHRHYVFVSELWRVPSTTLKKDLQIESLNLNVDTLRALGSYFVRLAVRILSPAENELWGDPFTNPKKGMQIESLNLNVDALRAQGGDYVISAVEILNAAEIGLIPLRSLTSQSSPWTFYLYQVPSAHGDRSWLSDSRVMV